MGKAIAEPVAVAGPQSPDARSSTCPVLEVRDLRTQFLTDAGVVRAVDGVSFSVIPGETLGIVGESGSGKSVTALSVMRLLEEGSEIAGGRILFRGRDVLSMTPAELRAMRGGNVAMVFQDPMTSLNPVLRVARQLEEAMTTHGRSQRDAARRSVALLGRMGMVAPERAMTSYPHQFSGGMRQRVVVAMGMSNEPALLLADEPTTSLDVTIQAQILALLRELNQEFGTAIVLISHDLGVIASVCTRVAVMYAGEIVEEGPTENVLADPAHPYTRALMNAVPRLDGPATSRRLTSIEGMPPDALHMPAGCRFAPRCAFRQPGCERHPDLLPLVDLRSVMAGPDPAIYAASGGGTDGRLKAGHDGRTVEPDRKSRCWLAQEGNFPPSPCGRGLGGGGEPPTSAWLPLPPNPLPQGEGGKFCGTATMCASPGVLQAEGQSSAQPSPSGAPLLQVQALVKHYSLRRGFGPQRAVHAVDGVDLSIARGEVLGVVGESGCGKSSLGRTILRLELPDSGHVRFDGIDISRLPGRQLRPLRRRMQMVFQDPYSSLNPRMTVGQMLAEPLLFHGITKGAADTAKHVSELLGLVGLPPASAERYAHEFSGGQRQRIAIARALAPRPDFIVADEPVSALDVNIQAQIINLLLDLQEQFRLTYMFIAHDLAVVRHISHRVAVLHLGKVVELAPAAGLFKEPLHPYTRYLISAVPVPDVAAQRGRRRLLLQGEPASPIDPPSGCRFRARCPLQRSICAEQEPASLEHQPGRFVACHFPGQL